MTLTKNRHQPATLETVLDHLLKYFCDFRERPKKSRAHNSCHGFIPLDFISNKHMMPLFGLAKVANNYYPLWVLPIFMHNKTECLPDTVHVEHI